MAPKTAQEKAAAKAAAQEKAAAKAAAAKAGGYWAPVGAPPLEQLFVPKPAVAPVGLLPPPGQQMAVKSAPPVPPVAAPALAGAAAEAEAGSNDVEAEANAAAEAPLLAAREDGAAAEPPSKKAKTELTQQQQQKDAITFFTRMAAGQFKRASTEQVAQAKIAVIEYNGCGPEAKVAFGTRFAETKKTKDFAWTRNFKESFTTESLQESSCLSKTLTRKACTCPALGEGEGVGVWGEGVEDG